VRAVSTQQDRRSRPQAAAVPPELAWARAAVAAACRDATLRVRRRAVERAAAAHARAALEAAAALTAVDAAAAGQRCDGGPSGRPGAVPVGRAHVRRQTRATSDVDVPVLAPVGRGGGVCAVADEDGMADVLVLLESLVLGAAVGTTADPPLVVINPRARPLPPSVTALPGLCVSRDARPALAAALRESGRGPGDDAGPPAHLVVLDFPHGLGLAGRRMVHDAATAVDGAPWPLLLHATAEAPEVDPLHRRFRIPRCGVPMPAAPCELWWSRGRWMWTQHPGLVVRVERLDGRDVGPPVSTAPGPVAPAPETATDAAPRAYSDALDDLVGVARRLDEQLVAIRARERAALDDIARRRRRRLDDLLRRGPDGDRAGRPPGGAPLERAPTGGTRGAPPGVRGYRARADPGRD
jgi:hypothetical protein